MSHRNRAALFYQLSRDGQRARIAENVVDAEFDRREKEADKLLYDVQPLINLNPDPPPCMHRKMYMKASDVNRWFCPECKHYFKADYSNRGLVNAD